jgi:microcystin-dependent protein
MSDPFLGEIRMFGFNFAPRGWAFCAGQLLPISQNSALFSLLGTIYGGDGRTTFALPDLRGRVPTNFGTGPGLSPYTIGQRTGAETHTMTVAEMPAHGHTGAIKASSGASEEASPQANGAIGAGQLIYNEEAPNVTLNSNSLQTSNTGGNLAFNIRQPTLAINFCIALQGIFPSRS